MKFSDFLRRNSHKLCNYFPGLLERIYVVFPVTVPLGLWNNFAKKYENLLETAPKFGVVPDCLARKNSRLVLLTKCCLLKSVIKRLFSMFFIKIFYFQFAFIFHIKSKLVNLTLISRA